MGSFTFNILPPKNRVKLPPVDNFISSRSFWYARNPPHTWYFAVQKSLPAPKHPWPCSSIWPDWSRCTALAGQVRSAFCLPHTAHIGLRNQHLSPKYRWGTNLYYTRFQYSPLPQ